MISVIQLSSDTLVTPELIKPLLDDIGEPGGTLSKQANEAVRHAADYYFNKYIEVGRNGNGSYSVTVGELNSLVLVFYDAYTAGLANIGEPKPS